MVLFIHFIIILPRYASNLLALRMKMRIENENAKEPRVGGVQLSRRVMIDE